MISTLIVQEDEGVIINFNTPCVYEMGPNYKPIPLPEDGIHHKQKSMSHAKMFGFSNLRHQ